MENVHFEITHGLLLAILAKHIDVPAERIQLRVKDELGNGAIMASAFVSTDISTAVKIDRKLKRLAASDADGEPEVEPEPKVEPESEQVPEAEEVKLGSPRSRGRTKVASEAGNA